MARAPLFLAPLVVLPALGCVTAIRPPSDPEDPVPVVLVDYGYHSSLILPDAGGGSVEYAYGEWNWFALNQDRWYNAFPALCWPTRGALGRRRWEAAPARAELRGLIPCEEMFEFNVARARAEALGAALNERYQREIHTAVYNPVNQLTFVHDERDYCCWVNCNHILALWLRELGCGIGGAACFSAFRVEPPQRP